jgi:hypothetical protein
MAKFDITRTNDAVTRLLEVTENPRHRFMLMTYYRHRYLEIAGRYEEIFAPDMMVENPVYHFHALGLTARLEGQDHVKALYTQWAKTGECVFYVYDEQLAIGDTMICSIVSGYQPKPGAVLLDARSRQDRHGSLSRSLVHRRTRVAVGARPWERAARQDGYDPRRTAAVRLGKRVGFTPSRVRIPHPPPL